MEFANYFDIIIIAIIIILAFKGLFTGFIREALSVIGIVGGVIVASRFNIGFGEWINSFLKLKSQTILDLIGFMIILGAIWILSIVLAEIVVRFVKFIKLGKLDRILGVIVAGLKIFLITSIILFTFSKINFLSNFTEKLQDTSYCYPIMIKVGDVIVKTDFVSETKDDAIEFGNQVLDEVKNMQ
ncbi:CvpA family protein [Helicobacter sp. MIT 99-5507]|uniref:CvpA family protein n=1 Tax=Helicobacter sp. MIT 99-5507 TaxID=152489 RepID=UPI000E1EDAD5|nr:CvpA family protein [Helicobacter sp. MIT 99-5507]RDU58105.1 colicin V synthesis protein [Helicobacter sp. MIT 99-5507]